jgi:glycosyltransferase involved in cell wall biosynthesis
MAAGRPVVSTRVGGVVEVVEEGHTGLLAPSGDDEALAESILRLAGGPRRREEMGRAGQERAGSLFSEPRMHDRYRIYYDSMLTG